MGDVKNFYLEFLKGLRLEERIKVCLSSERIFNWSFETLDIETEWILAQRVECPQCHQLYNRRAAGGAGAACVVAKEWCRATGCLVNMCGPCYLQKYPADTLIEDKLYAKTQQAYALFIPQDECLTITDNRNHPKYLDAFWYKVMHYELTRGGYKHDPANHHHIHDLCIKLVQHFRQLLNNNNNKEPFIEEHMGKQWKEDIREFVKYASLFLL